MKKNANNPMHNAKRCHAHSKRTGSPCNAPAVKGWNVCRMHGAGGGAPTGQRNGNYRHGQRTKEALAVMAEMRALVDECRAFQKRAF